jgi:hypothetical protein
MTRLERLLTAILLTSGTYVTIHILIALLAP